MRRGIVALREWGRVRHAVRHLRRLLADDGLAITEYGLLVALIVLMLIAVVSVFGGQIAAWFAAKAGSVTTV